MTIKVGDTLPDVKVTLATKDGPAAAQTALLFAEQKIALVSVPGAFTPTCSARHLPSYKDQFEALKAQGIEAIYCMSVNDAFVMAAWGKDQGVDGLVTMIADGNGDFATALGLTFDGSGFGMGTRAQRFSLVADKGVVTHLFVEAPGAYEVSSAEHMLAALSA